MNNNDYVNLLTTIAHEKGKDRKLLLKMEIAKATDPLVKEQLQLLLEEQESQERRNKFIAGIFFAVLFVAFILIFMKWIFYPNNEIKTNAASSTTVSTVANTNDDTQSSSSLSDSSTAEQQTRSEASQSQISDSQNYSTTNLSENEAVAWIKSYLYDSGNMHEQAIENSVFISELDPNNFLQVTIHSNNRLVAIFRIDGNGNLQETRDFAYLSDWETVRTAKDYVGDSSSRSDYSINNNHDQANAVRELMVRNQGFDPDVLAAIPDEEILAANVGNATNSAIAQTAKNLLDKYPNLKN